MSGINVKSFAYVRFRSPDLDAAEEFLTHFGLVTSARTDGALYMRATDPEHHVHVTERGEPKFIGFAYEVASEDDLERAARLEGASAIEPIDEPGGGRRVRLREPNGYQIELVHGIERLPVLESTPERLLNTAAQPLRRAGVLQRLDSGISRIKRLGHASMATTKYRETNRWFQEMLGLIASDDIYAGAPDNLIATFSRLNHGEAFVDHHVVMIRQGNVTGFEHVSFEVNDFDEVARGHSYMKSLGRYEHLWGLGRHTLGSQVYDYWADPWGRAHERTTDVDRINARAGTNALPAQEAFRRQWGEMPSEKMLNNIIP